MTYVPGLSSRPVVSLSLILPTLNERENVELFVPELLAKLPAIEEIIVVDDASSDGTPEAVLKIAETDPRVRLLERHGTPCLTDSLQEGLSVARGDLVGWMDADLVILPADFQRLVSAVEEGADVAVGSRFALGGRIKGQARDGLAGRLLSIRNLRTTEDPWLGVMLSWALNGFLLPFIVGMGTRDYTSGIVVARRSVLEPIVLKGDHGEYFIQLWAELIARGKKVVEVPYQVQPRQHGRSKTGNDFRDYARRGTRYVAAGLGARRTLKRAAAESEISGSVTPARAASSRAKPNSR